MPDSSLNLDIIEQQAKLLVYSNISYAFIAGTTGESVLMTVNERKALAERWKFVITKFSLPLQLIVHVGAASVQDAIDLAKHAEQIKADAFASTAPFFFKPATTQALVLTMTQIAKAAPKTPFYYYHIPSMTGVTMPLIDFLNQASGITNLVGAKFSHTDLSDFGQCCALGKYNMLFGTDQMMLGAAAMGADGYVGSTYNLPFMTNIYYAVLSEFKMGNMKQAQVLQSYSWIVVNLFNKYGGAGTLKAMMNMTGIDLGAPRLPLMPISSQDYQAVYQDLKNHGLLK